MIKATAGSVAAKQGYDYANKIMNLFDSYNLAKHTDKNLCKLASILLKSVNIKIDDVISINAKKTKNHLSKPDFILCISLIDGTNKELGISVKKGSNSTISFNNQSLNNFIETKFGINYSNAFIGLAKWLGLDPFKSDWIKEYGHEHRPQGCYLIEELKIVERQDMVKLFTDEDFLKLTLKKIFISNNALDTEMADIIFYPKIPNSIEANDIVICNTTKLIETLLAQHKSDKNIIQNIDPNALPKAGIRKDDKIPNTIQFFDGLFHFQRKSSSGVEQTNLLVQVNLKKLDLKQKKITKIANQLIGGKNTFVNKKEFRIELQKCNPSIQLNDYIIRSSSSGCELFKENFKIFWTKTKDKFNFSNCNEKDVFEGIQYILGANGYSPIQAFQNFKIEKINKNELLVLKSLPYYYLKGSIKQEIKKFFDDNIRCFLDEAIFNSHNRNLKGIIFNKTCYMKTKLLNPIIITKDEFLINAVKLYNKQTFDNKTKSLNLGSCNLKRYGGGGLKASENIKSSLVLMLNNDLCKVFTN
jgi:hypothetical protein